MIRRGLSLIELLLSILIVAIATGAATRAYLSGVTFDEKFNRTLDAKRSATRFEDQVTRLLRGAELGTADSVFISPAPASGKPSPGVASLVFTTWSAPVPSPYADAKGDFETLNERFGPQAGPAEVSLSTDPVGEVGGDVQGLFLRTQRPPDGDPSQGGEETLLDERVRQVEFSFSDGQDWLPSWDSKQANKDKMPVAVRVRYLFGDETTPRTFLVRLPLGGGA